MLRRLHIPTHIPKAVAHPLPFLHYVCFAHYFVTKRHLQPYEKAKELLRSMRNGWLNYSYWYPHTHSSIFYFSDAIRRTTTIVPAPSWFSLRTKPSPTLNRMLLNSCDSAAWQEEVMECCSEVLHMPCPSQNSAMWWLCPCKFGGGHCQGD